MDAHSNSLDKPSDSTEQDMGHAARRYEEGVGRGGGIRTHDPSVPNAVRYQTALRPDIAMIIRDASLFVKCQR